MAITRQRVAYFIEAALQIIALGLLTMLIQLPPIQNRNLSDFPRSGHIHVPLFWITTLGEVNSIIVHVLRWEGIAKYSLHDKMTTMIDNIYPMSFSL